MSLNTIRENKILAKISEFAVLLDHDLTEPESGKIYSKSVTRGMREIHADFCNFMRRVLIKDKNGL